MDSCVIRTPPLRRSHDKYLMPVFQQSTNASKHLCAINRCRIFLKAITIADITTSDGKKIRRNVWEGQANEDKYWERHQLNWPQQGRPSNSDWQHWRSALKCLLIPYTATRYLSSPLGEWCESECNNWKWFLDTPTDTLWERIRSSHWKTYSHRGMHGRPTAGIYIFAQEITSPGPLLAVRAEVAVTLLGDRKIVSTSPCPTITSPRTVDNLLDQIKSTLTPSQQYLLNIENKQPDRPNTKTNKNLFYTKNT